ncbi:hypothetical protein [Macrococcus armenti]|uniref:hypothetical protein n=1 Tax=Macrococcus armenti TaxID=2875764 RepID=UPI001CCBBFB4|nr:hypothetical protein [Macrococcus armenti]UBH16605.1 hypothetical protein LAU44_11885 [Macrococcus armenti]UBH21239.1 hypothetical protein LAU40_11920 [Macrococcus armenti]
MKKVLLIVFKRLFTVYVDLWKRFYMTMFMLHFFALHTYIFCYLSSNSEYEYNERFNEQLPYAIGIWLFLVFLRILLTSAGPQEVIIVEDRRKGRR